MIDTSPRDPHPILSAQESEERWVLVERLERSSCFSKAVQLRSILHFICQRSMVDQVTSLREHEIAISALGRRKDFDPASDTIVRVQIAHLRKRLEVYFATEGHDEALVLTIPKGTYVPHFELRTPEILTAEAPPSAIDPIKGTGSFGMKASKLEVWAISILLFAGVIVVGVLLYHAGQASSAAVFAKSTADPRDYNVFTSHIFISDMPVSMVAADSNLALMQQMLHTDISINDYVSNKYPNNILDSNPDPSVARLLTLTSRGRYTSYGDANIALACAELARKHDTHVILQYARFLNIRDFQHGNFILSGSRRSDPWVTLFEPKLNFFFEEDPTTHVLHLRNRSPRADEQTTYVTEGDWSGDSTSYVGIALLPNLTNTGYVLLLNGAGMEATEAAAEFVFGKESSALIGKTIGTMPLDQNAPIEILLRVHSVQGTTNNFDIIGVRKVLK